MSVGGTASAGDLTGPTVSGGTWNGTSVTFDAGSSTVVLTYGSREGVRWLFERRWRAGIGLKRILIAGAGDLGRMVADRTLTPARLASLLGPPT